MPYLSATESKKMGNCKQATFTPFFSCLCVSIFILRSFLRALRLCRSIVDDRISDILKIAAFAQQPLLYEMRPSSTKLQEINVLFHSSHNIFQHACAFMAVLWYHVSTVFWCTGEATMQFSEKHQPSFSAVKLHL